MDAGRLIGRGIAFPPRVGPDGRVAWSEGDDNVREGIRVTLMTELNERLNRPDFGSGLAAVLFEPNTTATHAVLADRVRKALARWEPRAVLDGVAVAADPDDPEAAVLTISYRLVATRSAGRLVLSVPVGPR
ncbi:MAG TPA: GPW/gp25 family protein [Gemmataceae bacterium]|nr:GPW/gp25 family protein [Gemmataceae bacterium]